MSAWKPCSESLPEPGENVIVACNHGLAIARREWEQGRSPDHWRDTHEHRIEMKEVTHWMSLPVLPSREVPRGDAMRDREKYGRIAWEAYRAAHNKMVEEVQEPEWEGLDHERQVAFRDAAEAVIAATRLTELLSVGNALAKEAFERGIHSHVEAWDSVAR